MAYPGDGEGPVHAGRVGAFRIDRYAVTNRQFAAFVEATGWRTEAEWYGWSFVFGGLLPDDFPRPGASRRPRGGVRSKGRTGAIPRARSRTSLIGQTTRWSTSRGTTPWPTAPGRGPGCPPRPSGRWRPVVGWRDSRSPGGSARTGRRPPDEHLPGGVPRWQHRCRRLPGHGAGRRLPAQRVRPVQHDRQRLGVVRRLAGCRLLRNSPVESTHGPRRPARPGRSGAGPTCATPPTVVATGCRPGSGARRTARPATSVSGWSPTR